MRRVLLPAAGLGALVALWAAWVAVFDPAPYLLPSPLAVAEALGDARPVLSDHVRATVQVALLGLAVAAAVGVAVAVALWRWSALRQAAYPLLIASQSVPSVVLAPVFVTWFGFGLLPRVLVVALVGFFPVAVAVTDGLLAAPRPLGALVTSMGAGRWRRLLLVDGPSALPSFFSGLTVAASYAVFGAIVAEWMGATEGLGVFINRSRESFRTDRLLAAVVVIAAVSLVLVAAVRALARTATPWADVERAEAAR